MAKIPELHKKTGLSDDYLNEYSGRRAVLRTYGRGQFLEDLREYPIKKYIERFPPEKYPTAVTYQNMEAVAELDRIAEEINSLGSIPEKATEERISQITDRVKRIIRG